jgi:hypothetical protein
MQHFCSIAKASLLQNWHFLSSKTSFQHKAEPGCFSGLWMPNWVRYDDLRSEMETAEAANAAAPADNPRESPELLLGIHVPVRPHGFVSIGGHVTAVHPMAEGTLDLYGTRRLTGKIAGMAVSHGGWCVSGLAKGFLKTNYNLLK